MVGAGTGKKSPNGMRFCTGIPPVMVTGRNCNSVMTSGFFVMVLVHVLELTVIKG